jgi:hypothetical protein
MGVGVVIAGGSGLCSLAVLAGGLDWAPLVLLIGGVPLAAGIGLIFGGRALIRSERERTFNPGNTFE